MGDPHLGLRTYPERSSGARPPVLPTVLSVAAVLGSAALLVTSWDSPDRPPHWIGWALGSVVTCACVVLYRLVDRARSRRSDYATTANSGLGVQVAAVVGFGLAAVHGWSLASWLAVVLGRLW